MTEVVFVVRWRHLSPDNGGSVDVVGFTSRARAEYRAEQEARADVARTAISVEDMAEARMHVRTFPNGAKHWCVQKKPFNRLGAAHAWSTLRAYYVGELRIAEEAVTRLGDLARDDDETATV